MTCLCVIITVDLNLTGDNGWGLHPGGGVHDDCTTAERRRDDRVESGGDRPGAGRIHATGEQGDGEREIRTLPHQNIPQDRQPHRKLSQSSKILFSLRLKFLYLLRTIFHSDC